MSLVNALLGVMVAVIVGVGVAIPVVSEVITNASLTGTTALVAGFLPVLVITAIVMGIVAIYR